MVGRTAGGSGRPGELVGVGVEGMAEAEVLAAPVLVCVVGCCC